MLRGCSRYLDPHIYVQHGTENRCAKSTINTKKRNPGQKINVLKIHKNRHKNKIENWCTKKYPQNMSQKIRHKWPKINLQIGISSRCFLPKGPPSVSKGSPPPWGDWALFFGTPCTASSFSNGQHPNRNGEFFTSEPEGPPPPWKKWSILATFTRMKQSSHFKNVLSKNENDPFFCALFQIPCLSLWTLKWPFWCSLVRHLSEMHRTCKKNAKKILRSKKNVEI